VPEIGQIVVEHLPGGAAVVALCGEHDLSTVPALRAELDAVLATSANVIIDLSEATFIDSSIVAVIFHAAAPAGQIIAIAAPPDTLPRRLIDMVALTAAVPTFDSRAAAVGSVATGGL
jgi:anti-sigma B factor antagonist